jgi:hypothetical protein
MESGRDPSGFGWGALNDGPVQRTSDRTRLFAILSHAQNWTSLTAVPSLKDVDLKYIGMTKRRKFRSAVKVNKNDKSYSVLAFDYDATLIGISISSKSNPEVAYDLYFDKDHFTVESVVYRFAADKHAQPKEVEFQYGDFREVNGIRFPFTEALVEDGRIVTKEEYDKVTIEKLDKSFFEPKQAK